MSKKITHDDSIKHENTRLDFGFGPIADPAKADFETLARGIGLDPVYLASFLDEHLAKSKPTSK